MEISDVAFERLQALLGDSESGNYGIAILMGGPAVDHVRTNEGKYEWRLFGDKEWVVTPLPLDRMPPEQIHVHRGIKFFLNSDPVPTKVGFAEGRFIINDKKAI